MVYSTLLYTTLTACYFAWVRAENRKPALRLLLPLFLSASDESTGWSLKSVILNAFSFHENFRKSISRKFLCKIVKKWKIGKIWIKSLVPRRNQTFSAVRFITKFSTFRWKQLFPLYHQSKIRKININIMNTIWRTLTIPIIISTFKNIFESLNH